MIDVDAIVVALAARFAPGQVVPPPGYQNIQASFAYGPDAVVQLPTAIVNPPDDGALTFGGHERAAVHQFTVDIFLESYADTARQAEATAKWLTVLLDQLIGATQLGGLVALAWIARYTTGEIKIAEETFHGITLYVAVTTTDGIDPTS